MKKRYVFGGMATATAVVLGIGLYGAFNGYLGFRLAPTFEIASSELDAAVAPVGGALKDEKAMVAKSKVAARSREDRKMALRSAPKTPPASSIAPSELERGLFQKRALSRDVSRNESFRGSPVAQDRVAASSRIARPAAEAPRKQFTDVGRDRFANVEQNTVKRVADEPVSTFSIDAVSITGASRVPI